VRILLLTPLYPPAIGGAAIYFADIVPLLEEAPEIEQLVLLTEQMPGEPKEATTGKLTVLRLLPTRVSRERPYPIHALTYMQTQRWFPRKLARLVKECQIDLVHFHTRYRGKLAYRALAKLPVPVLADLRDKMSDPAALARCSQHLLCCAQGVKDFAIGGGYPVGRLTHIPIPFVTPVPLPQTVLQAALNHFGLGERPFLFYAGDMTMNKGVFALLDAFEQWQVGHPGIDLVLAGMNREGRPFAGRVEQVPQVHFLSHIPHAQALALMQASEMVLLPSRSEGLPLTILEAVALGKKVLCPPNIPEFDTHLPDFVLPEVTIEAILASLNAIWHNPALPGYPLDNHQVESVVARLLQVYKKMLSNRT
jgi:glycosyltransferase involved in cell wall biosynthesis